MQDFYFGSGGRVGPTLIRTSVVRYPALAACQSVLAQDTGIQIASNGCSISVWVAECGKCCNEL